MIKKVFKYHITVLDIYYAYGETAFAAKEIAALDIPGLNIPMLEAKGYLEIVPRVIAEGPRAEIRDWYQAPWVFRQLTEEGVKLAKYLDAHPNLIAKKLLLS